MSSENKQDVQTLMNYEQSFVLVCSPIILKGTVTQVLQVEINLNLALRGKNRKGDVFRIFDFGREHR